MNLTSEIPASEILKWINFARTKPKEFSKLLSQEINKFIDEKHYMVGDLKVKSLEGKSAFNEAIKFCEKQEPLEPLQLNDCLNKAASRHTRDMIKSNIFGHTGSDGSSMSERIS